MKYEKKGLHPQIPSCQIPLFSLVFWETNKNKRKQEVGFHSLGFWELHSLIPQTWLMEKKEFQKGKESLRQENKAIGKKERIKDLYMQLGTLGWSSTLLMHSFCDELGQSHTTSLQGRSDNPQAKLMRQLKLYFQLKKNNSKLCFKQQQFV